MALDDLTLNLGGDDPTITGLNDPTVEPTPSLSQPPLEPEVAQTEVEAALEAPVQDEQAPPTEDPGQQDTADGAPEEAADKPFFDLADIPKAFVTGTEGFFRDAYGLLDFIAADKLTDISGKPTSFKLNSTVGEFLSEVVNFGLGFVPVAGALGKFGKATKGFTLGKKGEEVARRAAKIAFAGGRTEQAGQLARRAMGIRWGRDFTAGAAVDFAFLDKQEERMSTILNNAPSLDPIIPDFLAGKSDDNQLRERLLAVVEGGVMGIALDTLFLGVKALKKGRDLRAKGKSPEQVARAMEDDQEALLESMVPGAKDRDILQRDRPAEPVLSDPAEVAARHLPEENPEALQELTDLFASLDDLPDELPPPEVTQGARLFSVGDPKGTPRSRRNLQLRQSVANELDDASTPEAFAMLDALDDAMRDDHGLAVRRAAEEAGPEYFARIGKLASKAIEDGKFGTEEIQNLVFAVRESLDERQQAALKELLISERDRIARENPVLGRIMGQHGERDVTRRDLWEMGLEADEINRLGDIVDRVSNQDRLLAHIILQEETAPAALKAVVEHGRRVFNAVADGFEAKFGKERAKAVFNEDALSTSNIVPGGNLRAEDMAQAARAEIEGSEIGEFATQIGLDNPESIAAAARLDRAWRVNPRDMKAADLAVKELDARALNLRRWYTTNGFVRLMRSMEWLYSGFDKNPVPIDADFVRASEYVQDIVDPAKPDLWKTEMFGTADDLRSAAQVDRARILAARHILVVMGEKVKGGLERYRAGEFKGSREGLDQLAELALEVKRLNELREFVSQWGTEAGRRLRILREPPTIGADTAVADDLLRRSGISDEEIKALRVQEAADRAKRAEGKADAAEAVRPDSDPFSREITDEEITEATLKEEAAAAVEEMGGVAGVEKMLDDLADIVAGQGGDITGLVRGVRAVNGPNGAKSMIAEFWYNSMLSSGRTFMVNLVGSLGYAMLRPMEIALGAAFSGDVKTIVRAKNEMVSLFLNLREGFKYGRAAWKKGDSILAGTGSSAIQEGIAKGGGAISTSNPFLSAAEGTLLGDLINSFGALVRLPTRGLMATDEAIKQIQFRTTLQSSTAEKLMVEKGLSPEEAWGQAADLLERHVRDGQAFSAKTLYDRGYKLAVEAGNPEGFADEQAKQYVKDNFRLLRGEVEDFAGLNSRAVQVAKEVTFTQSLPKEGFFSTPSYIAKAANQSWLVRLVLPFVRTPTNLVFTTGQHFDVISPVRYYLGTFIKGDKAFGETAARHTKFIQDMVSGDPIRAAEAKGKLAMGLSTFVLVGMAYANGYITGGGPLDPKKNKAWREAGWQPYSFRTPDGEFFSYERGDPVANMIGIQADFFEVQNLSPETDDSELEKFGTAVAVAVASNLDNKTYLSGLTDFLGAIGDPRESATNVFARMGGSVVPTILNDIGRASDPYEREARTFVEKIQKRIPGLREDLPIMRNMLGEPVNKARSAAHAVIDGPGAEVLGMWTPIAYNSTDSSILEEELQNVHYGFTPPSPRMGGVDLRDVEAPGFGTAYDRLNAIIPEIRIDGKSLRETLEELIQSEAYQRLDPASEEDLASPRVTLIQRQLRRYRRLATRQLQREFPEIRQQIVERVRRKRQRLLGRDIGGF